MNLRVAHGARLIFSGLIVRWSDWFARRAVHVWRMAAKTQEVDVIYLQQPRIRRTMRRVARQARLICLYRSMLKDERPHRVSVALGADRELSGGSANLMPGLGAVRIVAVGALDQSHLDPMPVGPSELGLLRGMTAEAQILLLFHQHEVHVSGFMRAVAGSATKAIRHVLRLGEILRLQTGLVALRADGGRLRRT